MGIAVTGSQFRWPNGFVPYVINDQDFPSNNGNRQVILDAILHWNSNTVMRIIQKSDQPDYIEFVAAGGSCSSPVGRQGGRQVVRCDLDSGNFSTGSIIHEIGHAIGLWHEHTREDRDNYVTINTANIQRNMIHNFMKHIDDGDDIGRYDYASIMHYPKKAFAIDNGSDTIITDQIIGQSNGLSQLDIQSVNKLYPIFPAWGGTIPGWPANGIYYASDLNGDNSAEVIYIHNDARFYIVNGSNGGQYDGIGWGAALPPGWPANAPFIVGDFDGDGGSEFAYIHPEGRWYIIRGRNGTAFEGIQWGSNLPPGWPANGRFLVADFDGDKSVEIAYIHPEGRWYIIRGRNGGPYDGIPWGSPLPPGWTANGRYIVGDFDGDGSAEIAFIHPEGRWYIIRGKNGGQYDGIPWGSQLPPGWPAYGRFIVADLDGDGSAEIMYIHPEGRWYIVRGRNGAQYDGIPWGSPLPPGWPVNGRFLVADLDGDRAAEIAYIHPEGRWYVIRGKNGSIYME